MIGVLTGSTLAHVVDATGAFEHRHAIVNDVRLHYVEAGPPDGDLIILLHGFPEFWYSWRHQIPALAAAGLHVIAPDMRGYNLSEKPRGIAAYRLDVLAADVIALVGHFGRDEAVIAGHDWGGVVAWHTAMRHRRHVARLIVLNAPHPAAFLREVRKPRQLLRSWYTFFFQLPRLPEMALAAGNYRLLRTLLRTEPENRRAFRRRDIERYVEALAQPGARTATLNYYRANLRPRALRAMARSQRVRMPVLLIWGDRDRYLVPELTNGLDRQVPQMVVKRLASASHWVQNDCPAEVNRLMLEFLLPGHT